MNTGSHLHRFSHDEVLDLVCSSLPSTSSILVLPFIPFHTLIAVTINALSILLPTSGLFFLLIFIVSILCLNPRLTLVLRFPASCFHPYLHSACGPCHYLILPTHQFWNLCNDISYYLTSLHLDELACFRTWFALSIYPGLYSYHLSVQGQLYLLIDCSLVRLILQPGRWGQYIPLKLPDYMVSHSRKYYLS